MDKEKELTFFEWLEQPRQIILFSLFFIILCWVVTKISSRKQKDIRVRDPKKGHRWRHSDFLNKPTYCSICETSLVRGSFCDTCWICVHDDCEEEAVKQFACKVLTLSRKTWMSHHWVKGNLPLCSKCDICGDPCGVEPRLSDFRCNWCQLTVHEGECLAKESNECDFGVNQELVIPPYCITLKTVGWRGRRRVVVNEIKKPPFKNWKPLLILTNPKSGGNEGIKLLKAFRGLLNPVQVLKIHRFSKSMRSNVILTRKNKAAK